MSSAIRPGDVLLGKLEVVRVLGRGASGTVYEVLHRITGHRRALKVLHADTAESSDAVARLVREAKTVGGIDSRHVVPVVDAGRLDDGSVYLLMELAEGRTLRSLLAEHGRLEVRFALDVAADVARGLGAVHAAGLVHRDVKPENLLVTTDASGRPTIKILDFGVQKLLRGRDAFGSLTPLGAAPGTLQYRAPEADTEAVDGRADLYALGVVLHEMLTGSPPFEGGTEAAVLLAIERGVRPSVSSLRPDADAAVDALVDRLMARDPRDRFAGADEAGVALRAAAAARAGIEAVLAASPLLSSRYEVLRRLGEGGMGTVYEVLHKDTARRRALKLVHPRLLSDEASRDRFRREATVAAEIDSEHVVDVLDAGVCPDTGMPFLVMELLAGEDLAARLVADGPLSRGEALTLVDQLAMALDRAHERGVVHRDLKPANVFLARRDDGSLRAKLLDFGIAKVLTHDASETAGGVGTPAYMAPEQLDAKSTVGPAADRHALGHLAFAALVGESYWRPEADRGLRTLVARVADGPKDRASERASRLGVALPPAFDAFFDRATRVEPSERFESAGALAEALRDALGEPRGARAVKTPAHRAPRPAIDAPTERGVTRSTQTSRTPRLGVAVAAALAIGVGAVWLSTRPAPAPAADPATSSPARPAATSATEAPAASSAPPVPVASSVAPAASSAPTPKPAARPAAPRPTPRKPEEGTLY